MFSRIRGYVCISQMSQVVVVVVKRASDLHVRFDFRFDSSGICVSQRESFPNRVRLGMI
ncbi:hypothetical protein BN13_730008 [Nostocoides jenkinsii Ben 74]|uniref:Uncharacterized protein n=1 Tax=Nostocoides jenkinsii Ben 74 TaxID=1193518 RepID=A0A077MAZ8_9MICO|nr:hypothetical protein BN13_1770003 [Tetrasphaera jenkinsii Ben 74]CCI53030.1 hypothetical protein BN13_280027 [Tetrasphaera jenkinsii Ben 74]CCI54233.1 hypothetical protein BN13_650001 [Tetrasphaera jenkinsii Ben 74]CCI54478.1 hypothetical protein BN13_730008 [Tetrasphaera jenkinsii Ben 74]